MKVNAKCRIASIHLWFVYSFVCSFLFFRCSFRLLSTCRLQSGANTVPSTFWFMILASHTNTCTDTIVNRHEWYQLVHRRWAWVWVQCYYIMYSLQHQCFCSELLIKMRKNLTSTRTHTHAQRCYACGFSIFITSHNNNKRSEQGKLWTQRWTTKRENAHWQTNQSTWYHYNSLWSSRRASCKVVIIVIKSQRLPFAWHCLSAFLLLWFARLLWMHTDLILCALKKRSQRVSVVK